MTRIVSECPGNEFQVRGGDAGGASGNFGDFVKALERALYEDHIAAGTYENKQQV